MQALFSKILWGGGVKKKPHPDPVLAVDRYLKNHQRPYPAGYDDGARKLIAAQDRRLELMEARLKRLERKQEAE